MIIYKTDKTTHLPGSFDQTTQVNSRGPQTKRKAEEDKANLKPRKDKSSLNASSRTDSRFSSSANEKRNHVMSVAPEILRSLETGLLHEEAAKFFAKGRPFFFVIEQNNKSASPARNAVTAFYEESERAELQGRSGPSLPEVDIGYRKPNDKSIYMLERVDKFLPYLSSPSPYRSSRYFARFIESCRFFLGVHVGSAHEADPKKAPDRPGLEQR